jgi:hypothetical protein
VAPIRIETLSRGILEFEDPASLIRLFVASDESIGYDNWVEKSPPDRVVQEDISAVNRFMRARSGHRHWEAVIRDNAPTWLAAINPEWDAVSTSEHEWHQLQIGPRLEEAFAAMCGPYRGLSIVSKVLHLKRPRLVPLLDALVIEQLGQPVSATSTGPVKARAAAQIITHLAGQARANRTAVTELQDELHADGIYRSAIRLMDILIWAAHPAAGLRAPLERRIRLIEPKCWPAGGC